MDWNNSMTNELHVPPDLPDDLTDTTVPSMAEIGLEQFAPYLLNRITNRWNTDLLDVLRQHKLTTRQMRTLAILSIRDGRPISELATLAVTQQSTMSRTLDAMQANGLVFRKTRSADGRFSEVYITAKGRDTFDNFWPAMYRSFRRMFQGIDSQEFQQFTATLHKILNNVRQHPF